MHLTNSLEKHYYECRKRTIITYQCIQIPCRPKRRAPVSLYTEFLGTGHFFLCSHCHIHNTAWSPVDTFQQKQQIWSMEELGILLQTETWESGQPVHLSVLSTAELSKPNSAPRAKIPGEGWKWMSWRKHEGGKTLLFWLSLCHGDAQSV